MTTQFHLEIYRPIRWFISLREANHLSLFWLAMTIMMIIIIVLIIILVIIECMGGGGDRLREQIVRVLETDEKKTTRTWREMLKMVLGESESIIRKVLLNIITAV